MSFFDNIRGMREEDPTSTTDITPLNSEEARWMTVFDSVAINAISDLIIDYTHLQNKEAGDFISGIKNLDDLPSLGKKIVALEITRLAEHSSKISLYTQALIKFLVDKFGGYEEMIRQVERYKATPHEFLVENKPQSEAELEEMWGQIMLHSPDLLGITYQDILPASLYKMERMRER